MTTFEIKKLVENFKRKYNLREVSESSLKAVFQKQGFTIIEFNPVLNDLDVTILIENLGLAEMCRHSNGFLYADSNYRLVFINKNLNTEEKAIILAHEEGHYFLGHAVTQNIIGKNVIEEQEANEFSHYLLKNSHASNPVSKYKKQLIAGIVIAGIVIAGLIAAGFAVYKEYNNRHYYRNPKDDSISSEEGSAKEETVETSLFSQEEIPAEQEEPTADTGSASSGICGDHVVWSLDNAGTLTISGTGDMYDYSEKDGQSSPWSNNESISLINIENGVTSIGSFAFYRCSGVADVTIPESVNAVKMAAFRDCVNLTDVIIPISVTTIGSEAFRGCTGLTGSDIPGNVISIGSDAFRWCTSLTKVDVHNGVQTIGDRAFYLCTNLSEVTIPESVKYIGEGAFDQCTSLVNFKYNGTRESFESILIGVNNDVIFSSEMQYEMAADPSPAIAPAVQGSDMDKNEPGNDDNKAVSGESISGIRPEIKEAIDSYEAFYDEYLSFMENYDESDSSMLTSYLSYMSQLEDTLRKIDEIENEDLSPDEESYFLEVMGRVNQKIWEANIN